MTRRDLLAAALFAPLGFQRDTRLIGPVPLVAPGGRTPPFGRLLGAGLDARLFTDLSDLGTPQSASPNQQSSPITPNDRFYVRTAVRGDLRPSSGAAVIDLARLGRVMPQIQIGPVLMECAGNSDPTNFGLISAAAWTGFPMPAVIDQLTPGRAGQRVLVSGADPEGPSLTSVPGASWIFTRDQLEHAVLAVQMNGAPLPRDHGFPARLIVPGWYGCACIKWVDRVDLVEDNAPATTQMREFAARTHQITEATLARDFQAAAIDTAAMPIRVEKWRNGDRLEYRITGIIWGGSTPTNALSIRFKSGQPWTRVDSCPLPQSTLTWSLWSHTWRPAAPGRYQIVLRVDDPTIRTRRLDVFFYVREIQIDEV